MITLRLVMILILYEDADVRQKFQLGRKGFEIYCRAPATEVSNRHGRFVTYRAVPIDPPQTYYLSVPRPLPSLPANWESLLAHCQKIQDPIPCLQQE